MQEICRKYAIKYAEKYARNTTNMQRNMTNMQHGSIMENMQEICKICKICGPCQKYAKYADGRDRDVRPALAGPDSGPAAESGGCGRQLGRTIQVTSESRSRRPRPPGCGLRRIAPPAGSRAEPTAAEAPPLPWRCGPAWPT